MIKNALERFPSNLKKIPESLKNDYDFLIRAKAVMETWRGYSDVLDEINLRISNLENINYNLL